MEYINQNGQVSKTDQIISELADNTTVNTISLKETLLGNKEKMMYLGIKGILLIGHGVEHFCAISRLCRRLMNRIIISLRHCKKTISLVFVIRGNS